MCQSFGECAQILKIYLVEVAEIKSFCGSEVIYDFVPTAFGRCLLQLPGKFACIAVVKVHDVDAGEVEITPACRRAYTCPRGISTTQSFATYKAANETTGTDYKYFFHIMLIIAFR